MRCNSRNAEVCASCALLWQRVRAFAVSLGLLKASEHGDTTLFVTLTAPGSVSVKDFNDSAPRLWRATIARLRRAFPGLEYAVRWEGQGRGAVHAHAVFVIPNAPLNAEQLVHESVSAVRSRSEAEPWRKRAVRWGFFTAEEPENLFAVSHYMNKDSTLAPILGFRGRTFTMSRGFVGKPLGEVKKLYISQRRN